MQVSFYIASGLMLVIGLVLIIFKPANLIAGYNTMGKAEKARWNEKALCIFLGAVLLAGGVILGGAGLLIQFDIAANWAARLSWPLFIALIIFAVIYANVSKRFKSK